jgi:hypothetical protein
VAIRAELSADRDRGAGHGLLRIVGLAAGDGPIDFSLRRNQGSAPYLGPLGTWQATEAWHPAGEAQADGEALVILLGPEIIDPIVGQAANVAYQLVVAVGAGRETTSLKVSRPLFGSGAAADEAPPPPTAGIDTAAVAPAADALTEGATEAAEPAAQPAAEAADAPPATRRPGRWPLVAVALALLGAGAGAGAWYGCLVPGVGAARCQGAATPASPLAASPLAASPPAPALSSCAGLDAAGCYAVGQQALQQQRLESARQLLQQAAGLGSIEANLAVGRMYDPGTWSAATSPVAQPDWETAVFWYEKAARQGNAAAQATAGRLLCAHARTDLERRQGRDYLEQAAKAGDADARQHLDGCR